MTLAFPAWRKGFFKATGAVIEAARRRGHRVLLIQQPERKPGEAVTPQAIRAVWPDAGPVTTTHGPETVTWRDFQTWLRADAIIGPALGRLLTDEQASMFRAHRTARVSLDLSWDSPTLTAAELARHDLTGYATAYQRGVHRRSVPTLDETRTMILGLPQLDQEALIDRATVRARYGLDPGKPIVLLFAAKLMGGNRRWLWRWIGYRRLVRDLEAFCARVGAQLVVKTRAKHGDPGFLARVAPVIDDRDLVPYTSLQLLSVASLAFCFQSGACLEAAALDVPMVSIRIDQRHLQRFGGWAESYADRAWSMTRWAHVIESVTDLGWLDHAATAIPYPRTGADREGYRRRYLGEPAASARLLDRLEAA